MHKLRHFYYQNKEKIWKVILIIVFVLGIIYFLNWQTENKTNQISNSTSNNTKINYEDDENKTYISDKSAITGSEVTESTVNKINNTISKFLQYCKNENYEEAYNMISFDCKKKKYSTLEEFIEKYVQSKFSKNNVYEIEEWILNTYRVSISEDALATGQIGNKKKIEEYITIVKENSSEKLNINSYVKQEELGKSTTKNDVKITAINKEVYMDYEIYNLKVENLSNKTIKIDALEKTNSIYLEDLKENKYYSYSHEILEDDLVILPKMTTEISIKFSNAYSTSRTINKIVFSNFIYDNTAYENEPTTEKLSKFIVNL